MGHKRLALEAGEDPVNNPLEYILECIDTIYLSLIHILPSVMKRGTEKHKTMNEISKYLDELYLSLIHI